MNKSKEFETSEFLQTNHALFIPRPIIVSSFNHSYLTETMTAQAHGFPFLLLPPELRQLIYVELLCPDPHSVKTLYHDRYGRDSSFNIHPSILRVNRQINAEATSLLYDHNVFKIDIATRVVIKCKRGLYLTELFRDDVAPNWSSHQGLIYPQCLSRLRHLEIQTSLGAVLGSRRGGCYFSHIGNLLLKILQNLIEPEASTGQGRSTVPGVKTLKFGAQRCWGVSFFVEKKKFENADDDKKNDQISNLEENEGMRAIYALLRATTGLRTVSISDIIDDKGVTQIREVQMIDLK